MTGRKDPPLAASFISHLRQTSRVTCPVSGCNDAFPSTNDRIHEHFKSKHGDYIEGKDLNTIIRDVKNRRPLGAQADEPAVPAQVPLSTRDPGGGGSSSGAVTGALDDAGSSSNKRRKAPVTTPADQSKARSSSPPKRSRAQHQSHTHDPDFVGRGYKQGKLWNPEQAPSSSTYMTKPSSSKPSSPTATPKRADPPAEEGSLRLIKQPETRPISQEQLVAEVKGIYAGLMMVESKCIEVDNAQSSQSDVRLNNDQWQALIALHRTLLHEHHDFFLASQHPAANQALKRLASKYAMPARMWRHGIHSFLELLRHRLPVSLEHMLTFIYLAYSMMALLYETVPAFEDTWIECLGDLGRYRMAIEDEDIRDREVWTSVSRHWYSKASDKAPTTGRLYHHLAILARPNALQQLFYYVKSLCVPIPFASTKESIMTLFDPIISMGGYQHARLNPIDVAFVKAHAILFSRKQIINFRPVVSEFLGSLDSHIDRNTDNWKEAGYYIATANCCAILSYGREETGIMGLIRSQNAENQVQGLNSGASTFKSSKDFEDALHLAMGTHEVVFRRWNDANVLPYTHVVMAFMVYLTRLPNALQHLERQFPWKLLSLMLNKLLQPDHDIKKMCSDKFPRETIDLTRPLAEDAQKEGDDPSHIEDPSPERDNPPHPLPEDFILKGFEFADYPQDLLSNTKIDDDEKYLEMPSMTNARKERILWLAYRIVQSKKGLTFNEKENTFGVFPEHEKEIKGVSEDPDMDISDASNAGSQAPGAAEDEMDIDVPSATTL
ncbi:hypothetical protein F4825DRAFT_379132 [Nemania diffusa]|nr:hypothetical protein F4825DRAFT_379132 [Nemania diffusa]